MSAAYMDSTYLQSVVSQLRSQPVPHHTCTVGTHNTQATMTCLQEHDQEVRLVNAANVMIHHSFWLAVCVVCGLCNEQDFWRLLPRAPAWSSWGLLPVARCPL